MVDDVTVNESVPSPGDRGDADDLVATLPSPYAIALRLRRGGHSDAVIAEALAVDPDVVPTLLLLAEAKLAARRMNPGIE